MKLSKAEYRVKTMNLDEDSTGLPSHYPLNKVQAVRIIERLHQASIAKHTVPDVVLDWRGILEENLRSEAPDSSFLADGGFKRRGNRGRYGVLPCYRSDRGMNCRVFFNELDIIGWFKTNVEPVLAKPATITTIAK